MSIISPDYYTPERVILEISKLILDNPAIRYFSINKEISPDSVPTIEISLELYECKKEEY